MKNMVAMLYKYPM